MRKQQTKTTIKEKGFTLIETFVAITILMIIVLGPMSLLSNALRDSRIIGNEITAAYLAQEGVELIIDYRNNSPSSTDLNPLANGRNYYIDNALSGPQSCGGACPVLKLDPAINGNGYQYTTGGPSLFTRTIKIDRVAPGQYVVVSTVSWQGSPRPPIVSSSIILRRN